MVSAWRGGEVYGVAPLEPHGGTAGLRHLELLQALRRPG